MNVLIGTTNGLISDVRLVVNDDIAEQEFEAMCKELIGNEFYITITNDCESIEEIEDKVNQYLAMTGKDITFLRNIKVNDRH